MKETDPVRLQEYVIKHSATYLTHSDTMYIYTVATGDVLGM